MTTSNSDKLLITGYVTPRPFGPFAMPVPAQNSCLREYTSGLNAVYGLPQCENIFPNSYVQLFGTVNSLPENSHMAMYSFHMFPNKHQELLPLISIIENKRLSVHFVLEQKILKTKGDLKKLLRFDFISKVASKNNNMKSEFLLSLAE